jgi:hypothetical protein
VPLYYISSLFISFFNNGLISSITNNHDLCKSLNFKTLDQWGMSNHEECIWKLCKLTDAVHLSSFVTYVSQMFIEVAILIMERCWCTIIIPYYGNCSFKRILQRFHDYKFAVIKQSAFLEDTKWKMTVITKNNLQQDFSFCLSVFFLFFF